MINKKGVLKKELEGKQVLTQLKRTFKPGKHVKVDRARLATGSFVIYFGDNYIASVDAKDLPDTVEFS